MNWIAFVKTLEVLTVEYSKLELIARNLNSMVNPEKYERLEAYTHIVLTEVADLKTVLQLIQDETIAKIKEEESVPSS